MENLKDILIGCINGGISEDKVFAEYPFTKDSRAKIVTELQKLENMVFFGTISQIQETAIVVYGGIVPELYAADVAEYMISNNEFKNE